MIVHGKCLPSSPMAGKREGMINDHTLTHFNSIGNRLLKPIYEDYTFANLPATLHYLLTGDESQRAIKD
jgi:hypothetical protein